MTDLKNEKSSLLSTPWFKIDNAANLYAAARRKNWCRTLRMAAVLDEEINKDVMQQALVDVAKRFPSFTAKLRDGLFWSYFERTTAEPVLFEENDYPYRPIPLEGTDQPNFRVQYYKNRVSVEVFHSVADGGATVKFLSSLVTRYYELLGEEIEQDGFALRVNQEASEAETVDDYVKNSVPKLKAPKEKKKSIYFKKNKAYKGYSRVTHGLMNVEDIHKAADKYSVTITEYLSALLIYTIINTSKKPIDKTISISIPIDLRRRFNSESVRNFTYMKGIDFNPGGTKDISFSEICAQVDGKIRSKATPNALLTDISSNVNAQLSPVLRPIPYVIKRAFLKLSYRMSQRSYSLFFSNYGEFQGPKEVMAHIKRADLVLGDTPYLPFGCSAITANGLLNFCFSNSNDDMEFQKFFFRFLAQDGVPVRVESNIYE